jgi:hypothetical protein
MPRKPVICAYCGEEVKKHRDGDKEHFVPKCLWDGPRPNGTITVRVHKRCNRGFSTDDEYLRTVLTCLAYESEHPEVARLLKGSMARCFAEKPGLLAKHLAGLAVRPMTTPSGLYVGHAPTFILDERRLAVSLSRMVRGLYFASFQRPLPRGYGIVVPIPAPLLSEMAEMTATMSPARGFGDDVFLWRSVRDPQDENSTCWFLAFYGAVHFFGWTIPEGHELRTWSHSIPWMPDRGINS